MTSISKKADLRKPRRIQAAAIGALGAIVVLGSAALVFEKPQPALAASEQMASAIAFRILSPQTIDRLAGLAAPETASGYTSVAMQLPSALDDTSCVAVRAGRKTDRHDALDPKAFCQLQHRLFNAELIGRIASLERASQARLFDASSQLAMNKEF